MNEPATARRSLWMRTVGPARAAGVSLAGMTGEFAYTIQDLKEGMAAHARARARRSDNPLAASGWRANLVWYAVIAAVVAAFYWGNLVPVRGGAGNSPAIILAAIAATVVLLALVFWFAGRGRATRDEAPVEQYVEPGNIGGAPGLRGLAGWVLFVGLAAAMLYYLNRGPGRAAPATPPIIPPPGQSMWATFLVPMAPWLLIFAIVWVFIFVQVRMRSAKAAWEKYPSLQLRRRLDADPSRFVIDDTQSRTELTWPAVKHFVETPNLFLLYVESDTFHIIPKRAFAGGGAGGNAGGGSDGNVDSFRELLRANVQPATRAFPVQPVRPT